MARAPESPLTPRERKKYVLDGEKVVFALHQHWLVLVEPVVTVVALLALAIVMDVQMPGSARGVADAFWWIWFASIVRGAFVWWQWRHEWVIATDKRMMRVYGYIDRKVAMVPLGKVTDMRYDRTILGRMLNYGTFVLESAGQVQALREIPFVPHPDDNYRALVAQIFGVEDEAEVDEDLLDDPDTMDDLPVVEYDDTDDDRYHSAPPRARFGDRYGDRYGDLRTAAEDDRAWETERGGSHDDFYAVPARRGPDGGRRDDRYVDDDRYETSERYDDEPAYAAGDEDYEDYTELGDGGGYTDWSARQHRLSRGGSWEVSRDDGDTGPIPQRRR